MLLLERSCVRAANITCDCLAQVEYAIEAISHAGSAVGIMCAEGVVLAAEKKILSKVRGVETRRRCQCRLLEACLLQLRIWAALATLRFASSHGRATAWRQ